MIIARKLEKGDKVAIVSLSSGVLGEEFVQHEVKLLEERLVSEFGLRFEYMKNARKGIEYLREHPEARAADLRQAFLDPEVKMIWCAIGGTEEYAILPYLLDGEFGKIVRENPKIFMGFSDTTNSHLALYKLGLSTYYGPALLPDVAELGPEMIPYTKECIKNLFKVNRGILLKSSPVWYRSRTDFGPEQVGVPAEEVREERGIEFLGAKKRVSGALLGGCIDVLSEMLEHTRDIEAKTPIFEKYQVFPEAGEWRGKVLFIEPSDNQPAPEEFRKMLSNLEQAGVFEEIAGMLVGKAMDEKYLEEYREAVVEIAEKYGFPVAFNLNFGHGAPRMILPIGQEVVLDPIAGEVRLAFSMVAETDEGIKEVLRGKLDERRYEHCLAVAEEAKKLAEKHGLSAGEAYTAGLVHDAAKRLPEEENRRVVEEYGLSRELLEEGAKNYIHADVGAVVAKEWFGLSDEIAEAVRFHTIPDVSMTDFDKVVFLADKIGRKELALELLEVRELAYEDLDAAMLRFLELQEAELEERGIKQHPRTREFMEAARR